MQIGIARVGLVVAAAALSLFGPRSAPAAPYTGAFAALKAQLEYRRDNEFLEAPLDKTMKKQQKAILKGLALLERPADDLGDDLKTLLSLARVLERDFPADFDALVATGAPIHVPFQELLLDARSAFIGLLEEGEADLGVRIGKLSPSRLAEKAKVLYQKASRDSHTYQPGPFSGNAKLLLRSWQEQVKSRKLADKGTVLPAPSMTFTVSGTPHTADTISWSADTSSSHLLSLTGSYTDAMTGNRHNVRIQSSGVTGPGTYPAIENPYSLGYWVVPPSFLTDFWSTDATGGTFTIDALDVAGASMSGSFAFTATGGPSSTQVTVTGTFTATWNLTVESLGD